MSSQEFFAMQAENAMLRAKVSGICKVYFILKPVLKFVKIFAFIKKGAKTAIDAAIVVLDEACAVSPNEN